jgi:hypothetical protein
LRFIAAVPGRRWWEVVKALIVETMPRNVLAKFSGFVREKDALSKEAKLSFRQKYDEHNKIA